MENMIIPGIVFLPFFSFIAIALFGRKMGGEIAARSSTFAIFYSMLMAWLSYWYFSEDLETKFVHYSLNWFSLGFYELDWEFIFDPLTSLMFVVVTTVSFWVHYYSYEYMDGDPHRARFFSYLSLFTFFMLVLVSSTNLIQLFIGWEGVGLCSFLLINFWFTRYQANKSAIKAVLMNRFGDIAFLMGIVLLIGTVQSASFYDINMFREVLVEEPFLIFDYVFTYADIISFCFLVAAVGKSAQVGLHTWLPDAMEGPTPVSALIHAATMVTAGVFLLLRTSFIIDLSLFTSSLIIFIGAVTALFGASVAVFQNDIKKVVAYSTCSQLGYMVFACGIGAYPVAMFHLFNHAFFKALLFLSAGSVIHGFGDEQDMRKMGGLHQIMPFTYLCFLIGSLSLMGFPFLTGFYSKDFIIELAGAYGLGSFVYLLLVIAAFFTAYYSGRLLMLVFYSEPRGPRLYYELAHEPARHMTLPLFALYLATLFFGFYFRDMIIGHGTEFWQGSLCLSDRYVNAIYLSELNMGVFSKSIPLVFSVLGFALSYFVFNSGNFFSLSYLKTTISLNWFFSRKWYFDPIYNVFVAFPFYRVFYSVPFKAIDKGVLEHIGPYGLTMLLKKASFETKQIATGYIFDYLVFIVIGFGLFLGVSLYTDLLSFISLTESACLVVASVFTTPLFLYVQATKPPEYL